MFYILSSRVRGPSRCGKAHSGEHGSAIMKNLLQDSFTRLSRANGIWCEPVNSFTENSIEARRAMHEARSSVRVADNQKLDASARCRLGGIEERARLDESYAPILLK